MDTATLAGSGPEAGLIAAVRPLGAAPPWRGAWAALAAASLDPNPFYAPGYALPAAGAFGAGVRLLLVADRPPEAPGTRLLALWPFRRVPARWGLPLPVLMGWTHGFCPYGAPLLDRAEPERALAGLLAAPRALGLPPRLYLPNLPAAGPFADGLAGVAAARALRRAAYWPQARALLDLAGRGGAERAGYLAHMPGSRRRKLRQGAQRLAAAGPVTHETLRDPAALAEAVEDYVALEAAGWKGRAGTAVADRPAEHAFLRAMAAELGPAGGLRVERLRRGGRTLASAILPVSGDTLWCLKIAHDEAEAAHSPGVQLVHRLTLGALADPAVARVDSCSVAGYRLGEMFWTERRAVAHVLLEAAGGDPLFRVALAGEGARDRLARWRAARGP
ncbi:GNAT family N-acetyltransferase [Methylobacterium sp. A54F]